MKKTIYGASVAKFTFLMICGFLAIMGFGYIVISGPPSHVHAQSGVGLNFGPIVTSVANCYVDQNGKPGLPGASVLCTVGSGSSYTIYESNNRSEERRVGKEGRYRWGPRD